MKKLILSVLCVMITFFISAQHTITINLTTDNYGSETTWKLFNMANNNEILAEGGPYADVSQVQTIAPISVDGTGCYIFEIYDAYGDGIQGFWGSGSYSIYYDTTEVASGGNFGAQCTHLIGGSGCPINEISLIDLVTTSFCHISDSITIAGTLKSYGISTDSYAVTYKIDNGAWVADQYNTCSLNIFDTHNFVHHIPASFITLGSHTITVKVHSPNGAIDDTTDNELSFTLYVYDNAAERKILLEHFTTAQCSNCPYATENLTQWVGNNPDIIWISHHVGYYTDEFTIPESSTMLSFYNSSGTYAPAIMLDRTHLIETGEPGPVFYPDETLTPILMDDRINAPAFVTLDIAGTLSENENRLNLTISGEFLADINPEFLRLSVYITEDGLIGSQSGASSNYTHNHVVRDAISGAAGDNIFTSTTAGSTFSKTYTYEMDESWIPENCKVIAFINNWHPDDVNKCEVFNAEQIEVSNLSVDINENDLDKLAIYPNPANNVVNVYAPGMEKVEILNAIGQVVYNSNMVNTDMQINIESLTEGIYFIRVSGAEGSRTQKLIKK